MKNCLSGIYGISLFLVPAYFVGLSIWHSGMYVYPLDDTYIHLSMAKHAVYHGVWGVTLEHFSSSTSSPLYTALQAVCMWLFGAGTYYPLVLNVLFCLALFYILHRYLQERSTAVYAIAMGAAVWFTPIYIQVLSGMEHLLHTCLMVLFVLSAYRSVRRRDTPLSAAPVYLSAFLSTAVRYESLFIILPVGVFFLWDRQWKKAFVMLFAGIAPVWIYGVFSMYHGAYFIPNSLLIKGNTHLWDLHLHLLRIKDCFRNHPHVPLLLLLLLGTIALQEKNRPAGVPAFVIRNFLPLTVSAGIFLHMLLAGFGWLYRYEAYLIVLSVIALVPLIEYLIGTPQTRRLPRIVLLSVVTGAVSALGVRLYNSGYVMQKASVNIFEQQYQISRFLHKYYNGQTVVANDIGAICYYADIGLVDVVGLGTHEVVKIKRSYPDPAVVSQRLVEFIDTRKPPIMVIYDDWFPHAVPERYTKIAEWEIADNRVCGDPVVSFYAVDPQHGPVLRNRLLDFAPQLPPDVKVTFMD